MSQEFDKTRKHEDEKLSEQINMSLAESQNVSFYLLRDSEVENLPNANPFDKNSFRDLIEAV